MSAIDEEGYDEGRGRLIKALSGANLSIPLHVFFFLEGPAVNVTMQIWFVCLLTGRIAPPTAQGHLRALQIWTLRED